MRNRILDSKGTPTRVDAPFLRLQTDFTLGSGNEDRVHFRTLSKRSRDRILASADEQNKSRRDVAEKALAHVKKQKTVELTAHV